jgi:hypothetical protein
MQFSRLAQHLLHPGIQVPNTRIRTASTLSFLAPHHLKAKAKAKRVMVDRILKDLGARGADVGSLASIVVPQNDDKKSYLISCEMGYQTLVDNNNIISNICFIWFVSFNKY